MKKRAMYVKPKTEVLQLDREAVVVCSVDNVGSISGEPGTVPGEKIDIDGGGF